MRLPVLNGGGFWGGVCVGGEHTLLIIAHDDAKCPFQVSPPLGLQRLRWGSTVVSE